MAYVSQTFSWKDGIDIDADEEVDEGGEGRNTLDLALLNDDAAPLSPAWTPSLLAPPEVTEIEISTSRHLKANFSLKPAFENGPHVMIYHGREINTSVRRLPAIFEWDKFLTFKFVEFFVQTFL